MKKAIIATLWSTTLFVPAFAVNDKDLADANLMSGTENLFDEYYVQRSPLEFFI